MFELHQLEQLVTIAEQGTITKAAEILHISQPALTRSIQKLEDDLGINLFSRSKNKVILNETGLFAVELAYKIIEGAKYMVERIHAFEKSQQSITIGSCAPGPLWVLESVLKKDYSSAQITSAIVDDETILKNFEDDIYQIIITTKPINNENIFSHPFCHEKLCISLPPAHPLSNYTNVSFEDLNGESLLLYSMIGFWYNLCKEMMPDSLFIVQDQTNTLNELIKFSALPNFITNISIKHNRETSNRIIIPINNPEANVQFYCSCKKSSKKKYQSYFIYED